MKKNDRVKEQKKGAQTLASLTPLDSFLFREMMNVPELHDMVVELCMEQILPGTY